MPGPKKVDWKPLRDAYVTEDKSARELARQHSLSNSTVSAKAREEDWEGQRLSYKNSIARRSYEKVAESVANEQVEITKENILAARMYIRKFIADVNSGAIKPNAKDAIGFIQLLAGSLIQTDKTSDQVPVLTVEQAPDAESLWRLLDIARSHVPEPGSMGTGVLVDPPTTRPN